MEYGWIVIVNYFIDFGQQLFAELLGLFIVETLNGLQELLLFCVCHYKIVVEDKSDRLSFFYLCSQKSVFTTNFTLQTHNVAVKVVYLSLQSSYLLSFVRSESLQIFESWKLVVCLFASYLILG